MTIIEYENCDNITVEFDNGYVVKMQYGNFIKGNTQGKDDSLERLHEIEYNKYNSKMEIIKYINSKNITVKFCESGYTVKSTYQQFKNGEIRNPYDKTVYNIACIGDGTYKVKINNKTTKQYITWRSIIQRCYDLKYKDNKKTYEKCIMSKEWLNFQNFAQWYTENWYEIEGERLCLDKDLLHKENKIYSPSNCVFIPYRINLLLINRKNYRGGTLLGASRNKNGTFSADGVDANEKSHYLGSFPTEIEAFNAYKDFRENVFKEVAEEYKGRIPDSAYQALIHRKIDITD
jgi:hypothetical protein